MAQPVTTQSLKDLLRYPFRREGWQREFLIGSALILGGFFIPFVPHVFALGYAARVMRQAIRGEKLTLPTWDAWGDLGSEGLRLYP